MAGADDEDGGIEIAKKFSLKDVAISCPFLVHMPATTASCRPRMPRSSMTRSAPRNTIRIFTTEEGGAEHAHVDNRQIGIDFVVDWLSDNMK